MRAGKTGRRAAVLAAAAALAASGAAVPPAAADGPDAAAAASGRAAQSRTVTLVTGDEVTLTREGGTQAVTVRPGEGREDIGFVRGVVGDTVTVLPSDALALVRQGALDKRLFDIGGLIAEGYDDASRSSLPLIIGYTRGAAGEAASDRLAEARTGGASARAAAGSEAAVTELPSIGAEAVRQPKADAADFWAAATGQAGGSGTDGSGTDGSGADGKGADGSGTARSGAAASVGGPALAAGISRIWLDGRVHADLDRSTAQIGAPQAWRGGLTGEGVDVAVLDTGIDATHPDLSDAVAGAADFTGNPAGPADGNGHGTHVASVITGSGAASGGKYAGVAPDARLFAGKVLDDNGDGWDSQIIAGMEWAAGRGADVVNMSLGGTPTDGTDPLSQALDALTESSGALFVVAAGNDGRPEAVSAPASADAALAVGAVDRDEALADFSSRGPRVRDHAVKPEITAPGVAIVAARAAGTSRGEPVDEHYTALGGTSMATPHVAGAAAILAQQHPGWTPGQLKAALVGSARPHPGLGVFQQGTGRVDVAEAVSRSVHATPGTASLVLPWGAEEPVERTITYRNDGDEPVQLALALEPTGEDAAPASLRDTALTVPAHGTAGTVLTGRPGSADPGTYAGVLTATAPGGTAVRTAVSVLVERETYPVTLDVIDRDGGRGGEFGYALVGLDQPEGIEFRDEGGALTGHAPPGRYTLAVMSFAGGASGRSWTLMSQEVTVGRGPVALTADARRGEPVAAAVDSPAAVPTVRHLGLSERFADGSPFEMSAVAYTQDTALYAVPSGDPVTSRPFAFTYMATLAEPPATPGTRRLYNLLLHEDGAIPADPSFTVRDADLAKVRARYHGSGSAVTGSRNNLASLSGYDWGQGGWQDVAVPGEAVEYFSPGPDVSWTTRYTSTPDLMTGAQPKTYTAGRASTEDWFEAAFGPTAAGSRCGGLLFAVPSPAGPSGRGQTGSTGAEHGGGSLVLLRGGEEIAAADKLSQGIAAQDLPAGAAGYALRMSARHSAPSFPLATRVEAEWTFTSSGSGEGEECAELPLLNLKADGDFPLDNRAPANRPFPLAVSGGTGTAGTAAALADLTMEASYDDGRTWTAVPVARAARGTYRAVVPAPRGDGRTGYVSLRATAHDSAGNGVTQEVVRAYGLRQP